MSESKTLTVVDVGSAKVLALVGEADDSELGFTIIGVGRVSSQGIRRGQVVDLAQATSAIRDALIGAQVSSGVRATRVIMSINGASVDSRNVTGTAPISRGYQGVTQQDVNRALEAAQAISLPSDRDVLHVIPRRFRVDDQEGVRSPLEMLGFRLEVEAHLITISEVVEHNLLKCAHAAGVEVSELVFAPLASAEAVLTSAEREMGVVAVDIGGGVTGITIFIEGAVWHTAVLEVGGSHFTSDLAQVFSLPLEVAEHLKLHYGHANPDEVPAEQICDLPGFGDEPRVRVRRYEAAEVLAARAEELFELIVKEIARSGYDGLLPAGLVLTGGGALLPGLRECARRVTGRPVRVAQPQGLHGLVDTLHTPSASAAIGLMQWGMRELAVRPTRRRHAGERFSLRAWLRKLLP
ncbi:MAG: cell division protein FtsA [Thermoflexales bacterium]|nr:cell division protein FtsA [Thermoflexales bacterium]MCS7325573.1 cell division protein FtsA [Thermoflexales bacterium]MCX7939569.1 cell division protein FtsA [Thermoflexales bacterium]MDW8054627.1 cell division protein FtsA [Anaerolineae bacterium]MDW8292961.1 cell division protein FtsA [Anaerolineae bacterium]